MPSKFDRTMQKNFKECREWLDYPDNQALLEDAHIELRAYLAAPGELSSKAFLRLERLGLHSRVAACEAYGRKDVSDLALHLTATVGYCALVSRLEATFSAMTPEEAGGRPAAFRDSMKAAGPVMLGQWDEASICAKGFIAVAEKDQRLRMPESRRLRHGTVDAFLIQLFCQEFSIETIFQSLKPIHPAYATLLQHWNSADATEFITAMQTATEFHLSRSRNSTNSASYEFDEPFTQIFPVELLAVQSLRHRHNRPMIKIGHPLVDDTWAAIMQLPRLPKDPFLFSLENRLQNDFPLFCQFGNLPKGIEP